MTVVIRRNRRKAHPLLLAVRDVLLCGLAGVSLAALVIGMAFGAGAIIGLGIRWAW